MAKLNLGLRAYGKHVPYRGVMVPLHSNWLCARSTSKLHTLASADDILVTWFMKVGQFYRPNSSGLFWNCAQPVAASLAPRLGNLQTIPFVCAVHTLASKTDVPPVAFPISSHSQKKTPEPRTTTKEKASESNPWQHPEQHVGLFYPA